MKKYRVLYDPVTGMYFKSLFSIGSLKFVSDPLKANKFSMTKSNTLGMKNLIDYANGHLSMSLVPKVVVAITTVTVEDISL